MQVVSIFVRVFVNVNCCICSGPLCSCCVTRCVVRWLNTCSSSCDCIGQVVSVVVVVVSACLEWDEMCSDSSSSSSSSSSSRTYRLTWHKLQ